MIDKKWLAFQLLQALSQAHFYGICHGDIKTENVMVTSWNWAILTDFVCYKPVYLPEDNIAIFSLYFDSTMKRRTCYVAPERWYSSERGPPAEGELTPAMDVFSLGCVIAELFLEAPLFDSSQLLGYLKGTYDPTPVVSKIADEGIRGLILHMIQKDPNSRFASDSYIKQWTPSAFPEYFGFLHRYVGTMVRMNADERIHSVFANFPVLTKLVLGQGMDLPTSNSTDNDFITPVPPVNTAKPSAPETTESLLEEMEAFLEQFRSGAVALAPATPHRVADPPTAPVSYPELDTTILTPSPSDFLHHVHSAQRPEGAEGLSILLAIVTSSVRNVRRTFTRLLALQLFEKFAPYLDDSTRLQLIVPYTNILVPDEVSIVRATALSTLSRVLSMVEVISPTDANLLPDIILPMLLTLKERESEEIVKESFIRHLPKLAETAKRFLEQGQFYRNNASGGKGPEQTASYDQSLTKLQDSFSQIVIDIMNSCGALVKRSLLTDITRLCIFFGRRRTEELILPLLTTFLNDKDGELRAALFENIVGLSAFVGMNSLELFIFPCIEQAIYDENEWVVEKALNCTAELIELGLFRKTIMLRIIDNTAPMLLHPNIWIRYAVVAIMDTKAQVKSDNEPVKLVEVSEASLLAALDSPVTRNAFDHANALELPVLSKKTEVLPAAHLISGKEKDPRNQAPRDEDNAFMRVLENSIREEAHKLFKMRSYFCNPSRVIKIKALVEEEQIKAKTAPTQFIQMIPEKIQPHIVLLPTSHYDPLDPTASQAPAKKPARKGPAPKTEEITRYFGPEAIPPSFEALKIKTTSRGDLPLETVVRGASVAPPRDLFMIPPPPPDLGRLIGPNVRHKDLAAFQPRGILVAHLHEHRGAVRSLASSDDCMFFVSASDDGSAKIWDCKRLEKNVTTRSRMTFNGGGGGIRSVAVCENSHSVAVASDSGSINIVRIDYAVQPGRQGNATTNATVRYTGVAAVKTVDANDGAIVKVAHRSQALQSLVIYGTERGGLAGWDLRMKRTPFSMRQSNRTGIVTDFILDIEANWLLTGTSRGYMECWDLRFHIPVVLWRHPARTAIHCMDLHPQFSPKVTWITTATGRDVAVWDIEGGGCKQCFRVADNPEALAESLSVSPDYRLETVSPGFGTEDLATLKQSLQQGDSQCVRSVHSVPGGSYLLTGGTDRILRYWDLRGANSFQLSSPSPDPLLAYESAFDGSTTCFVEAPADLKARMKSNADPPALTAFANASPNQRPRYRGPKQTATHHREAIMSLHTVASPHPMVVSGGRDGVVKVWK